MIKFNERESWLAAAAVMLQHEVFPLAGIDPAAWEQRKYRVACGFPIGYRGSRTGKVTLGQAFDPSISADGTFEVFINPILDNPLDVIAVEAHEFGHVWSGIECGHRGEFARVCRAIGLEGPLTSTIPGVELRGKLQGIVDQLGAYPHAKVDPNARKKQGTRLLKLKWLCCGFTARASAMQVNRLHVGSACPVCGSINTFNVGP